MRLAELDALDEVGPRIEMQQRHEPFVERHRLGEAPGAREAEQRLALAREGVRHARDPADGADHDALDDDVVEPGEEHEAVADHVARVDEAARVAGGILEADDGVAIGERGEDVRA